MNSTENISLTIRRAARVSQETRIVRKPIQKIESRIHKEKEEETYINLYELIDSSLIKNNRIYLLAAIAFFAIGKML